MKKVIFAIALVAGFAACNSATTTETAVDSTKIADSIKAAAQADSIKAAAVVTTDSTKKVAVDSTKKAVVDSTKK